MKTKQIIKAFIPPVIFSLLRRFKKEPVQSEGWMGDYKTWAEAKTLCTGYDSDIILEKCKNSLLKVKTGEAAYERDSVLFNETQYSWGLLAVLQKAALENNSVLCVLDFGGSLGSTYYQNKAFLKSMKNLTWCIVEQAHFIETGKKYFEDEQLKFYHTIEDCLHEHTPNVLLLSSVLQYLPEPYKFINEVLVNNFEYIIFDRTAFVEGNKELLTIQIVPEAIYKASYPAWFFNYDRFIESFQQTYNVVNTINCNITVPTIVENRKAYWMGITFKKK